MLTRMRFNRNKNYRQGSIAICFKSFRMSPQSGDRDQQHCNIWYCPDLSDKTQTERLYQISDLTCVRYLFWWKRLNRGRFRFTINRLNWYASKIYIPAMLVDSFEWHRKKNSMSTLARLQFFLCYLNELINLAGIFALIMLLRSSNYKELKANWHYFGDKTRDLNTTQGWH